MKTHYGQLDLTKLGRIAKQHPELVKRVKFKDGEHQLLNIDIHNRKEADGHGNTAFIKASCKREEERQGVSYFIGDLKPSKFTDQPQQAPTQQGNWEAPLPPIGDDDSNGDLPFD
jgi:hypothetical protein